MHPPTRADAGIVNVRTIGKNQDGVVVCTFERTILVQRRGHTLEDKANYYDEEEMPRVPIKTKEDLPKALWPLWEKMTTYGAFESQAGAMAHRPPIFKNMWALLTELADEAVLPKRYLELCLVTVSLLNKCTYCVSHHAPKLAVAGISEGVRRACSTIGPIPSSTTWTSWWSNMPSPSPISGTARAMKYSTAPARPFHRGADRRDDWRIALCGAFNRFNDVLQLDIEPGVAVHEAAE